MCETPERSDRAVARSERATRLKFGAANIPILNGKPEGGVASDRHQSRQHLQLSAQVLTTLTARRQHLHLRRNHPPIGGTPDVISDGYPASPSTMDLLGAELELASIDRKTYRLADAIAALHKQADPSRAYTYVLVDCPPSLNLLTINSLCAADAILVPLQCEFFALEGLSQLIKTVERVKNSLNPKLTIQGVVLTMFDRRNNLSEQVAEDVRSVLGDKVYQTVIRPRSESVAREAGL
jgi:cellulose biosynthesis protein BcsQ